MDFFNKMINEMMAEGMTNEEIANAFTDALNAETARQKAEAEKNVIAVHKRADMLEILHKISDFLCDYYPEFVSEYELEEYTPEDAEKMCEALDGYIEVASSLNDLLGDITKTDKDEKHECKCHEAKNVHTDKDGFSFSLNTDDIKDFLNALLG